MEILQDKSSVLQGIYFQTKAMQDMYSRFPELLLIDATYKLNDLRMPLYILMIVDGNGESEVAALWLLSSEDKHTIQQMVTIFKRHNCTEGTKCIMADKDMTEREVLTEEIPNAVLLICLFHTLRTFRREITADKMYVTSEQRKMVLEIITKLVYARSESEYQQYYRHLKDTKLKSVVQYFDKNWHGIRAQWVDGLKNEACNFMNRTNNRLESTNQKIKSVVGKYSSLVVFFRELTKCLDSLALERDHRAILVFQKAPVQCYAGFPLHQYQILLMPFAFSYIVKQHQLAQKIVITHDIDKSNGTVDIQSTAGVITTSIQSCQCGFFKAMQLPCRHVFALRLHSNNCLFDESLCAVRWTRDYYLQSHRVFLSEPVRDMDITVSAIERPAQFRVLSQQEKYRKAFVVAQKIASLASEIPTRNFPSALQCLQQIVSAWQEGKHIIVQPVDPAICDPPMPSDRPPGSKPVDPAICDTPMPSDRPPGSKPVDPAICDPPMPSVTHQCHLTGLQVLSVMA